MRFYVIFNIIVILMLNQPSMAYNPEDLRWHTECLINSILTNDELDKPFIKTHLKINCDEEDIEVIEKNSIDRIKNNFLNDQAIASLKEEGQIGNYKTFFSLIDEIYKTAETDEDQIQQASCILVFKEVSDALIYSYNRASKVLNEKKIGDLKHNAIEEIEQEIYLKEGSNSTQSKEKNSFSSTEEN